MSTPILNDAADAVDGVIIRNPRTRGIFASVGIWAGGILTAASAGLGAATAAGWHAPAWTVPVLAAGYAIYGAFAAGSHGIWKANIK